MEPTPAKPTVRPTPTTAPFWESLQQHRIVLQYSPSAGQWVFYPRILAPRTLANDLEWREVSGRGTLYTFTVARFPTAPAWRDDVPQLLAVVELDEGPRLTTTMVNVDPAELVVGMRVTPVFRDDVASGTVLLSFEPDR